MYARVTRGLLSFEKEDNVLFFQNPIAFCEAFQILLSIPVNFKAVRNIH